MDLMGNKMFAIIRPKISTKMTKLKRPPGLIINVVLFAPDMAHKIV